MSPQLMALGGAVFLMGCAIQVQREILVLVAVAIYAAVTWWLIMTAMDLLMPALMVANLLATGALVVSVQRGILEQDGLRKQIDDRCSGKISTMDGNVNISSY